MAEALSPTDMPAAIATARQSLSIYQSLEDWAGQIRALRVLGLLQGHTGDLAAVKGYFDQALDLCHKLGIFDGSAWVGALWTHLLEAAGRYEEALQHALEAKRSCDLCEDHWIRATNFAQLTCLFLRAGRSAEAEEAYRMMNALFEISNSGLVGQTLVARAKGFYHGTRQEWSELEKEYETAFSLIERAIYRMSFMPALREEYASWLLEQHRLEDARAQLQIGLGVYKSVCNEPGAVRVQTALDRLSS